MQSLTAGAVSKENLSFFKKCFVEKPDSYQLNKDIWDKKMYKIYMNKRNSNNLPQGMMNNKFLSTKSDTYRSKSGGGKEYSPNRDYAI